MRSTMQEGPLTITGILRHGLALYGKSAVLSYEGESTRRGCFEEIGSRICRLASGLAGLGVGRDDRVATFGFNHEEHLHAYFAVPCMGAVLHTLNIRLFPDQLSYVMDHAEDKVVIADGMLLPVLARAIGSATRVRSVVVVGPGDPAALHAAGWSGDVVGYDELLAAGSPEFAWPDLDERDAAAMCYTTGTTGDPKGVVYSHRSTWLHSLATISPGALGLWEADRVLVVVPMFHANAWGVPYSAWLTGADMLMPQRFLQAAPLAQMIAEHRPTVAVGIPTIWSDLVRYGEDHEIDLSSLRAVVSGGAAAPRSLFDALDERYGVKLVQGWGMTETSPVGAVAWPARGTPEEQSVNDRSRSGRIVPGVELRVVGPGGETLPADGSSVGELEVRGPWVTASYYRQDAPERFHDGWLRTGDVGTLDGRGFLQITDRSKDVIKSGGEWISSVELENAIMGHPFVLEAAVVGVPDARWDERPLACVVLKEPGCVTPADLAGFLAGKVAKWWVPERWCFLGEVPKTSVGKFDKRALRTMHAEGRLQVQGVGD